MDELEIITHRGFDINVFVDESPESPREWDNLGTMVCWHNDYKLGDAPKLRYNTPSHFLLEINSIQININSKLGVGKLSEDNELLEMAKKSGIIILPLYLYDHSGITMNTTGFSCRWDSCQVGWIYITPEEIKKEYSVENINDELKKKVIDLLRNEVKIYDQYLTGDIYGYSIDEPINDSCWGFFGDHIESGLLDEAKGNIDYYLKET